MKITAGRRCLPGIRYTPGGNVQGMTCAFGGIEMAMWDARVASSAPGQTLFRWYADDVCNEGTPVPKNGRVPVPMGPSDAATSATSRKVPSP
ncbi:MAG: hypothetical protein GDA49_05265 [Rhodospirillales bacterium]|nr:hypothetical protein [Rhodospirillales bacterium]